MTTFPGSPKTLRGAVVLLDPDSGWLKRFITLQFNPESLSRSFQIQSLAGGSGDHKEVKKAIPGLSIVIPVGTHFQFRNIGDEPLKFVIATIPRCQAPTKLCQWNQNGNKHGQQTGTLKALKRGY